jgi:hypothetical protein
VDAQGAPLSTTCGLRVNSYPGARVAEPPAGLRAGDRVEIFVKARPPRDYLDPGAVAVKGFLAREKIEVMGSLRSGELLQLVDRAPPTISQRLACARGVQAVQEMQGRAFDWEGVRGEVLWPADVSQVDKAANDNSLLMRIQDG